MSDKCYRVEFTAHLHKLTLALKMQCEIQVVWKRGQKICESGKVNLIAGEANFDRKIAISCNMIFNTKSKIFREKITKFSIILTSDKGVKQAGEIELDVAEYINEKQLNKKQYDQKLSGCPDKNARLTFGLTGVLKEEISMDAISQNSYQNTENNTTVDSHKNSSITKPQSQNVQQAPTRDKDKDRGKVEVKNQNLKNIEQQNRKIREQLKGIQKLKQENDELRKKIKAQDYKKASQIKQKIEKYKKQIQKMKSEIRANKKIEDQTTQVERQILNCKIKIMKAFNYANDYGGSELVDAIQNYCGIQQK